MSFRLRTVLPIAAMVAVAALATPGAASATDDDWSDARPLLRSGLVGSTPAPAGPTLFGITPGSAPWVLDKGRARVERNGHVEIRFRGLVIPTAPANGTNPVPQISASVVCNGTVADTTRLFPFAKDGDARISDDLDLPDTCLAPAVLVHPNAVTSAYIAATG